MKVDETKKSVDESLAPLNLQSDSGFSPSESVYDSVDWFEGI
jgi:hypothetical protein